MYTAIYFNELEAESLILAQTCNEMNKWIINVAKGVVIANDEGKHYDFKSQIDKFGELNKILLEAVKILRNKHLRYLILKLNYL